MYNILICWLMRGTSRRPLSRLLNLWLRRLLFLLANG